MLLPNPGCDEYWNTAPFLFSKYSFLYALFILLFFSIKVDDIKLRIIDSLDTWGGGVLINISCYSDFHIALNQYALFVKALSKNKKHKNII